MLYLGHFSFEGENPEGPTGGPTHGWFTCVAEADSIELAVHKFRDLILGLKGDFEGFDSITKVYLDNCIEVKKMPPQGALAAFVENLGEPSPSISTELPGVSADLCMSYGWIAEEEDEEEEGRVVEPFVKFDE